MRSRILLFAMLLFFGFTNAQVFQEGFENGVPPTGWVQFGNGVGTAQFWQSSTTAFAGNNSAFVRYENVTGGPAEDWLVTSSMTLGAGDTILSFYQRQAFGTDYGSVYTVRVSTDTSQTNTANFVTIDTQVETDFSTTWGLHTVSLAAYANQTIYIAFVMANDDGDNWYLDEMELGGVPCGALNLAAGNITATSADITWNSISALDEIEIVPGGTPQSGSGTVVPGGPFMATGLTPGVTYDVYARGLCNGTGKIMIAGAWDGPLTGGQPKGVELYVIDDIPDMSIYSISSANNGTGTTVPNPEFTFPADSYNAGDYIYITSDSADFNAFFGFDADYITNAMLINGDDAVELIQDSTIVLDVFGDVNMDGTGTPWDYRDGWAYRMDGATPNAGTFVDSLWNYSGTDQLEGGVVNDSCMSPFPLGTFTTQGPSAWSMISFTTLCAPVQGDSIQDAIPVTTPVFSDSGSTVCYTDQIGNASHDAWYQVIITDPCVTTLDASLCGSGYDTFLRLLDASQGLLASNDDACGVQSEILGQPVAFGDTIYVVVEGYTTNNGYYTLNITQNVLMPMSDISYANMSYCLTDSNPTAMIMADSTGIFSSGPGIALDSATGLIDLSNSMPGTYAVLYTVGTPACNDVDTAMVTINPMEDASFAYTAATYCQGGTNPTPTVSGTSGGSFQASGMGLAVNAMTGELDLAVSMPGMYMVTYTTGGPCPETDSTSITITPADSASIAYPATMFCAGDQNPTPTISGAPGSFTSIAGLVFADTVGTIDLTTSAPGMYAVTYVTNGTCPGTATEMITINAIDDPSFAYSAAFYCQADSINPTPSTVATPGGMWSSTSGLSVNAMTGEIDLMASSVDSFHVLIYTTAGPCPSADTISVGVVNCPVGINDGFETGQYTLFPIPNQGRFFVQNNGDAEATTVEVMDMTGRILFNQEFYFQSGDKQAISLDNAAAGTYFLRVRTETRVETLRLQVAY